MDIKKLNGIGHIVADAYDDPNSSGRPLHCLYDSIIEQNPQLSKHEAIKLLLEFVEHLLRMDMIQLYGAYDKENNREVEWEGSIDEIISMLRNFVEKLPVKKLEQAHIFFYDFEYCFFSMEYRMVRSNDKIWTKVKSA